MNAKLFRSFSLTLFIVCLHTVHAMYVSSFKQNNQRTIQIQSLKEKYPTISNFSYKEQAGETKYTMDGVTGSGEEDSLTLSKFKKPSMVQSQEYWGFFIHFGNPKGQFTSQFEEVDPALASQYWRECEALRAKKTSE